MVENLEIAQGINGILETLLEAFFELKKYMQQNKKESFRELAINCLEGFQAIQRVINTEQEEPYRFLSIRCENCYASMESMLLYKEKEENKILHKLEFEYYPLLRIAHARFYYFALIEGNNKREADFWEKEAVELLKNPYIEGGTYSYDISICVLAYNKLEYTKLCVEAVLKCIPRALRCELILVNHGSTDETKEYFETIYPEKQINIKQNLADGVAYVLPALAAEGEYILIISNDVLLTKDAIAIMYSAMKKDAQIAYTVPTTTNIVNLQNILPAEIKCYGTIEEFQKTAAQYNREEKRKEESRVMLVNPLFMCRTEYWINSDKTKAFARSMFRHSTVMFWDDELSLLFRRAGYKNILMKDIVCYHFGSVTVGKPHYNFLKERKYFFSRYGIDPHEKGSCWTPGLFQILNCKKAETKRILSINNGLGSNSLKVKESIKEETGNGGVELICYTMQERLLPDLKGISDQAEYIIGWKELWECLKGKFDYILFSDEKLSPFSFQEVCERLYSYLEEDGIFILQTEEKKYTDWFEKQYYFVKRWEDANTVCCENTFEKQYFAVYDPSYRK